MSMKFLTLDNLAKIVEKFKSIFVKLNSDSFAEVEGLYSLGRDQYFTLGDPENLGIDIPDGKTHKILADQEWVTTKISEAELGGKDVDLSPYLTKSEASDTYLTKSEASANYTSISSFNDLDETVTNIGDELDNINTKFISYYDKGESEELFATKDSIINNITGAYFQEFSDGVDDDRYEYIGVYFDTVGVNGKPENHTKIFETASNNEVASVIDNAINS